MVRLYLFSSSHDIVQLLNPEPEKVRISWVRLIPEIEMLCCVKDLDRLYSSQFDNPLAMCSMLYVEVAPALIFASSDNSVYILAGGGEGTQVVS
jgi:hypothetical protein